MREAITGMYVCMYVYTCMFMCAVKPNPCGANAICVMNYERGDYRYVCMYVCMYLHMYICMYVCKYVCSGTRQLASLNALRMEAEALLTHAYKFTHTYLHTAAIAACHLPGWGLV